MRFNLKGDFPRLGLPDLDTLAEVLDLPDDELRTIASTTTRYYRTVWIPKRGSGRRRLDAPEDPLKGLQSRIEKRLLSPLVVSPIAFGGVRGRSHVHAAELHARQSYVATVDIRDFFPSITSEHVRALMAAMGCAPDVAATLAQLLTVRGCVPEGKRDQLPQGSPASTAVGNLLLHALDCQLAAKAKRDNLAVTRVVDDTTMSGSNRELVASLMNECIGGIHGLGLRVNRQKSGLHSRNEPQRVSHLNVNNGVSVPKAAVAGTTITRKAVRDHVRRVRRYGVSASERRSLAGKLAYIAQFHPQFADRMRAELDQAPSSLAS